MKTSATLTSMINANRGPLRRQKRGRNGTPLYEISRTALKSLTELQGDPLRAGLAVQVAINVTRATAA